MQIVDTTDPGRRIRARRRELGRSQAEIARRAGCSRQWMVGLEAGKETAEVGRVSRVLDALGLRAALEVRPVDTETGRRLDAIIGERPRGVRGGGATMALW